MATCEWCGVHVGTAQHSLRVTVNGATVSQRTLCVRCKDEALDAVSSALADACDRAAA